MNHVIPEVSRGHDVMPCDVITPHLPRVQGESAMKIVVPWVCEWNHAWTNAWMHEWMHACMHAWMNEWLSEWVNEWMNEWILSLSQHNSSLFVEHAFGQQAAVLQTHQTRVRFQQMSIVVWCMLQYDHVDHPIQYIDWYINIDIFKFMNIHKYTHIYIDTVLYHVIMEHNKGLSASLKQTMKFAEVLGPKSGSFHFIWFYSASTCLDSGKARPPKYFCSSFFLCIFLSISMVSVCFSMFNSIVFYPSISKFENICCKCSEGFLSLDSLFSW